MGLYMFSRAVKYDEVMAAFDSKNEDLFNQVKQSEDYQCYDEQPWEGCISMEEALRHIIFGGAYHPKSGHVYGYTFIGLCDTLSQQLPWTQELKVGYETDLVEQYLKSDFGVKNFNIVVEIMDIPAAKQLPKDIGEFPQLGLLENKNLKALYDLLPKIEMTDQELEELWDGNSDDDEDKACAYEHIKGLRQNLKFCMDKGLDLLTFCH